MYIPKSFLYVWSRNTPHNETTSTRTAWTVNREVRFFEGQLQIRHIAPESEENTLQLIDCRVAWPEFFTEITSCTGFCPSTV